MSKSDLSNIVDTAIEDVKQILEKKKNKGAAVGATVAYLLSKENKERNAILGGLAGYLLSNDEDDE